MTNILPTPFPVSAWSRRSPKSSGKSNASSAPTSGCRGQQPQQRAVDLLLAAGGDAHQLGLLVVWAVGAWQLLHHHITVGVLTAFIAYIGRFYTRVESMSRISPRRSARRQALSGCSKFWTACRA